jgi:hypothetical protein
LQPWLFDVGRYFRVLTFRASISKMLVAYNLAGLEMQGKTKLLQARVTPDIWQTVKTAAAECGLSVTAWMTMTLKREAAKTGRMPTKAAGRPAAGKRHTGLNRRGRGRP